VTDAERVAALVELIDKTIEEIRRDALAIATSQENVGLFAHMGTTVLGLETLKRILLKR
jgi:hypothetical protein